MLDLALGLLSGAGSLLSGLGARSAAKSQAKRQAAIDAANQARAEAVSQAYAEEISTVPWRVARDAEVAGFNPVTWLNAGALGFYQGTIGTKWQMFQGPGLSDAINIPSVMSAFGSALSSGVEAFGTQHRFDQKLAFEGSQLDKQLAAVTANRTAASRHAAAISAVGQSAIGGAGGPLYSAGSAVSSKGVGGLSAKATQVFPWLPIDKSAPDAQAVSDRYGEWGEDIAGGYNFATDMSQKYLGKSIPRFVTDYAGRNHVDMADFFSMDTARNRKFLADWFQPSSGPRVEWNNPFTNPHRAVAMPPGFGERTYTTGGGF